MSTENYIVLDELCLHYKIEMSFFTRLHEFGLIEIRTIESSHCIDREEIHSLEKMIRLHKDLDLNLEGIDTVFNLLEKIEQLQDELTATKNRLKRYED